VVASLAELERDTISERTVAALEARGRTVGIKAGIPPYGYRYEGKEVLIVEEQAVIVRLVFALRKEHLSYRAIAERVKQQTGTSIAFKTVQLILDRGDVYRGGQRGEREHNWPAILLNVA
jgi:DNA invertase Pin-like site-specific DNA recombinase